MYNVISQIINHVWATNDNMQQYILYICGIMIPLLTACFIDLVYRVFRHFWRR